MTSRSAPKEHHIEIPEALSEVVGLGSIEPHTQARFQRNAKRLV